MKSVIIPIDFSETSLNAARYTAEMLRDKADASVILFHLYKNDEELENAGNYLDSLKAELLEKGHKTIECILEKGKDLIDSLERLAYQKTATLIVMGITGKSSLKQKLIGSHTLKITTRDVCPVLIVPSQASFTGISNVALACDFKEVEEITPVTYIKRVLDFFKPNLHIVNVNSEIHISLNEELVKSRNWLEQQFSEFNPEFYFITTFDFQDTIEQFIQDKNIDIVINVPRNHNFFDSVFKQNVTKKLAFHSTIPVLAAHE
ncbi:MAG TPA: universal stress protein [Chitinophagaceae bacterium]|nr:universal stress protein [Chitinophagaceae bacterium]